MRNLLLAVLLGSALLASPPLHVAAVVRMGLPPFEDAARIYRLEGAGCLSLRVGEQLVLSRSGDRRRLGRLQVTAVKGDHALARLTSEGETYPLKGDLAVRHEEALGLPALPVPPMPVGAADLAPKTPHSSQGPAKGGPIFFLKGSAELSPGGRAKLAAWVKEGGSGRRWVLGFPEGPGLPPALQKARLEHLRVELLRLGVAQVEVRSQAPGAPGRYDSISVNQEARLP